MSARARECEKVSSDRHVRARTDRPRGQRHDHFNCELVPSRRAPEVTLGPRG